MPLRPLTILAVEDSKADQALIVQGLRSQRLANDIQFVETAEEALELMTFDYPDLVLIDINLPGMNGLELLKEMRSRSDLSTKFAAFLTTSSSQVDRRAAAELGAIEYLVKPVRVRDFLDLMRVYGRLWVALLVEEDAGDDSTRTNRPSSTAARRGAESPGKSAEELHATGA